MNLNEDETNTLLTIVHYLVTKPHHHHVFADATPPCIDRSILDSLFGRALTTFTLFGLIENGLVATHSQITNGVFLTAQAAVGLISQRLIDPGYAPMISAMPEPDGVLFEGADQDEHSDRASHVTRILDEARAGRGALARAHWKTPDFLSPSEMSL